MSSSVHSFPHPGETIHEDYLKPLRMSVNKLALELRVPAMLMTGIIHGSRGVSHSPSRPNLDSPINNLHKTIAPRRRLPCYSGGEVSNHADSMNTKQLLRRLPSIGFVFSKHHVQRAAPQIAVTAVTEPRSFSRLRRLPNR